MPKILLTLLLILTLTPKVYAYGKDFNMQEHFLPTTDHQIIAINHYTSAKDSVLIICPGWFMTKDSKYFKGMAEDFIGNTDVITMDFRGHGRSSGMYTFSAKEVADLKAVVDYAKARYKQVNLLGFSLGAAISIIYTAEYKNINNIICVSAPADFDKIEHCAYKKEAFIPTMQKFELKRCVSIRPGSPFLKKVKPIDVVQGINVPVLLIAGGKDPTVYPWHTKALYEKAHSPKAYELFVDDFHAEDLYIHRGRGFCWCAGSGLGRRKG